MPIVRGLISGTGALFGGCGLGACIEVAEQLTGRPLVWATAQYLTYARPPAVLEIDALEVVRGHQISQVRVARARRRSGDPHRARGARRRARTRSTGQWANRPDVPAPDDCPPRVLMNRHQGTISDRLEMRVARGRSPDEFPGPPGDGNSALWVRMPGLAEMSAAGLAIIGDFVPFGISQALGVRAGGNSLDNTLRVACTRADRLGARRHPRARDRRRLRSRPRAPLGRGRHPARHRQPVHDRPHLGPRGASEP